MIDTVSMIFSLAMVIFAALWASRADRAIAWFGRPRDAGRRQPPPR